MLILHMMNFMYRLLSSVLFAVSISASLSMLGCSLDAPQKPGGLKVFIEDANKNASQAENLLQTFASLAGSPSTTSDFTCFAVNVTGEGIPSNSSFLQGCSSSSNFHGVGPGIISNTVPKGSTIDLNVPSGPSRNIDVY